jgi:hypothetical protein
MPPQSKHCSVLFFEGVPQLPHITPHTRKRMHFWMEKGVNFFSARNAKQKKTHTMEKGVQFFFSNLLIFCSHLFSCSLLARHPIL